MEATLENERLRLELGPGGGIRRLLDRSTGCELVSPAPVGRLFRIVAPVPEWEGHHADSGEAAPETMVEERRIRLVYHGIATPQAGLLGDVTCEITLREDGLDLGIHCANRGTARWTEIWYPVLDGLGAAFGAAAQTRLLVPGLFQGEHITDPVRRFEPRNAWLTTSPGGGRRLWLYPRIQQWVDLYGPKGGLYFGMHDRAARVKGLHAWREAWSSTTFSLAWVRYPHLETGEEATWDFYRLRLHGGDWREGADLYRAWLSGWVGEADVPGDVREGLGWHFTILKHGDGRALRPYDRLPDLSDDAAAAGLGTLQVFGFHERGMDRGYPDYTPSRDLGGAAGLRRALTEIRLRGRRVALYQAGSAACRFSGPHAREVEAWAVRTGRGETVRADWTWCVSDTNRWIREEPFLLMCPASGWREALVDTAHRYVRDHGATAMHLDHLGDFEHVPCYAQGHRHRRPDEAPEELSVMLAECRRAVRAVDPEATLHCEGLSEVSVPWVDVHWGQNMLDRQPEVIRYVFPRALCATTIQENQYTEACRAFVLGLLLDVCIEMGTGSIASYPDFGRFLAMLARLRLTLRAFLAHGVYLDDRGLDAAGGIAAKVYRSDGGEELAVVAAGAPGGAAALRVQVQSVGASAGMEGAPRSAAIAGLDGSVTRIEPAAVVDLELQPDRPAALVLAWGERPATWALRPR